MRMIGKQIQEISSSDIIYLVENQISESNTLEYKRDLPDNKADSKKEFLADVVSFANTSGGVMIFGIQEESDEKGKNTGLAKEIYDLGNVNIDQEVLRLENMIRDGITPRLNNVIIKNIVVDNKNVFLMGIPRSLMAPHMVSYRNYGKFYSRNNAGKFQMDVNDIKHAFLQTDEWEKEADLFRRNRIMKVRSLSLFPRLDIEGSFFLHILPLGFNREDINLKEHKNRLTNLLKPPRYGGYDYRYNMDGFLVFSSGEDIKSYVQYFRNGGVEIYTSTLFRRNEQDQSLKLYVGQIEKLVIEYVKKYISFFPSIDVEPPFVIYLSFMDIRNGSIILPRNYFFPDHNKFDRDDIILPGLIIEDLEKSLPDVFRPIFDMIWQSAGILGSPYYNNGKWNPPS